MENVLKALEMIGPAGVVLVLVGLAAFYLVVRNGLYLWMVSREFRKEVDFGILGEPALRGYVGTNPMVDIIRSVTLVHAGHSEDLRAEVAYLFHRNFEKVERSLSYIKLISVISPLLGLLGTMLGMIDIFRILGTKASPDPGLLATGIWEALITTIEGLCIAIPTLFFHYTLVLRMRGFRIEAVEYSYQAMNLMNKGSQRENRLPDISGQINGQDNKTGRLQAV